MKKKSITKALCSVPVIVAPATMGVVGQHTNNINVFGNNIDVDLPFTVTTSYNVEYSSSGGSVKLIATDISSGGDISTVGSWSVDSEQPFYSITSKNYLYWSKPLDVTDLNAPHIVNVRFTITYSDVQNYDVIVPISINVEPNTHKLPIIQANYSSYYNPIFGGRTELVANIQGGSWSIKPTEHFQIINNNLIWDENVNSGSYDVTVQYKHKNYAIVSQTITLNLIKPTLNADNWIGKIAGTLRWRINSDLVSYYYSSNFKGADLVIPAFVFDNENNFYKVEIDDFVFAQTRIVGMATISDGVANIGHYAFSDSKYLTSLYLGNGLQNISSNAFNGCSSLTSISIPTSLSTIKEGVFADSIQIANIDLGERNEKLIVENNSFKNLPFNGNISCSGLWNSKEEIMDEFSQGGLPRTWTVNGK